MEWQSRTPGKSDLKLILTQVQKGQLITHGTSSNELSSSCSLWRSFYWESWLEKALTMIHSICLPRYDTAFPLSAESALSCTITGFVSLQLANNYLRNSMNKLVQAVWIHTLWAVQTEITCASFIGEAQPTRAHSCSVTRSKHSHITNRKPAAPINQIPPRSNPSQKFSCASSSWVMSLCAKTDKWEQEKRSTTLKDNSGYASSTTREWRSALT